MYATVVKSRPPEADGELDLCVGDKIIVLNQGQDGWMKGVIDENVGVFPADCVRILKHLFSVRVQYRYESQLTDELDLMVGDVVSVLDDKLEDDGWWFGELAGRVGVFPNNFVEVIAPVVNKPVIRKKSSAATKSTDLGFAGRDSSPKKAVSNISRGSHESKQEDRQADKKSARITFSENIEGDARRSGGRMCSYEGDVWKVGKRGLSFDEGKLTDSTSAVFGGAEVANGNVSSGGNVDGVASECSVVGGAVMEELARVCFNFEWFSMRHAKVLSQLVDEVEVEKRERKAIEQDLLDIRMLIDQQRQLQST